jgi:hypothetical protein
MVACTPFRSTDHLGLIFRGSRSAGDHTAPSGVIAAPEQHIEKRHTARPGGAHPGVCVNDRISMRENVKCRPLSANAWELHAHEQNGRIHHAFTTWADAKIDMERIGGQYMAASPLGLLIRLNCPVSQVIRMNLIRRLIGPVFIGLIGVAIYWALNFYQLNDTDMEFSEFFGEQFFSVLATLYAIVTALMLVKGLDTFDSLDHAIRDEAMKIRSINTYFYYFQNDAVERNNHLINTIRSDLIQYVANILAQTTAERVEENDRVITVCIEKCNEIEVHDENDRIALSEIIRGIDDLRALRSRRLNLASAKIPDYLIGMLAIMTVSVVLPFFLHHQTGLSFNYYIIFFLSLFGSFIYFLLTDLNKPYAGVWRIEFTPYVEAKDEIAGEIKRGA